VDKFAQYISELARIALLLEVYTTPKPGLVDRNNNGAHRDMSIDLFEKSASILTPFFRTLVLAGATHAQTASDELLRRIRPIGVQAEEAMFDATSGVNTHKGIIFSMGILCSAIGYQYSRGDFLNTKELWQLVAALGHSAVKSDLHYAESLDGATSGLKQYMRYGTQGIRGEVAAAMPSVRLMALPQLEKYRKAGDTLNDAGCKALMFLMSVVDDSNVISRSNRVCGQLIQESLREYLARTDTIPLSAIKRLDELFIRWNLSPGGCADLLSITYFLYLLKSESGTSIENFLTEVNDVRPPTTTAVQTETCADRLLGDLHTGLTRHWTREEKLESGAKTRDKRY
jgi:triphosphoribosyl-dephospho-CoA synthase CitG